MAMKESTRTIIKFLQANSDADMTAQDVAAATGYDVKVVNGVFTRAIQMKELGERVVAEVETEDGTHATVKFLKLNADGKAFNTDPVEE